MIPSINMNAAWRRAGRQGRRRVSGLSLAIFALGLCVLGACAGGSKSPSARATGVNSGASTGASQKSRGGADTTPYSQAAADLQALFENQAKGLGAEASDESAAPTRQTPLRARGVPAARASEGVQGPAGGALELETASRAVFAAPQAPATARTEPRVETVVIDKPLNRAELAFRLADRIRTEPGWSASRQASAMLGLELIEPGVGSIHVDDLSHRLGSEEGRVHASLRRMLAQLGANEGLMREPERMSEVLESAARELAAPKPAASLSLGAVAMCTRVESFGRYSAYGSTRFAGGRAIPIIVYTEVKNFTQRTERNDRVRASAGAGGGADGEAGGGAGASQYEVNLSQELALYLDSDGSKQWSQAEQSVKDSARSQRSDYYLVQRIDLPATLSVGRYNLKVIVRDKLSGAEVERAVPIEIVADAKLAK